MTHFQSTRTTTPTGNRFALWVDAVGGFLVCEQDDVVIGQASFDNNVDVPILGNLLPRHAIIQRRGDKYMLVPIGEVMIDGREIEEPAELPPDCQLRLGSAVVLQWTRPHPLSLSARLRFVSPHSTESMVDGVIFMAESLVLGPKSNNHVVCREWDDDVVLARQGDALICRAMQPFEIDGKPCDGRGRLSAHSRIVGDVFSLSVERLR
ncbi:MAG: hypothetical protein NXI22_25605 [bacterium]|nr:hypothetical protein [bacterium]